MSDPTETRERMQNISFCIRSLVFALLYAFAAEGLFLYLEQLFADAADRADKIFRQILKRRAGSDPLILRAFLRVIYITADRTHILCHKISLLLFFAGARNKARSRFPA